MSFVGVSCRDQKGGYDVHPAVGLDEFIELIRMPNSGIYGKDLDCPAVWEDHLKEVFPETLIFCGPNDLSKY